MQKLNNDKQLIFLQEGSNRILSRESKSFVSCSHMNCCLQKHTTYQSTYFIDYFTQGIIKNPRINEILYLHQKIHTPSGP